MAQDLIKADDKFENKNLQELTDNAMMIIVGAITNSGIYQDNWPWIHAKKQIRAMLK